MIEARLAGLGVNLFQGADAVGGLFAAEYMVGVLADEVNVLQVHTGLGLVQENQVGVLQQQLEQFGALDLPAGKANVDFAVEKVQQIEPLANSSSSSPLRRALAVISSLSFTPRMVGGRWKEIPRPSRARSSVGKVNDVLAL